VVRRVGESVWCGWPKRGEIRPLWKWGRKMRMQRTLVRWCGACTHVWGVCACICVDVTEVVSTGEKGDAQKHTRRRARTDGEPAELHSVDLNHVLLVVPELDRNPTKGAMKEWVGKGKRRVRRAREWERWDVYLGRSARPRLVPGEHMLCAQPSSTHG
jgi:hypothetical protein